MYRSPEAPIIRWNNEFFSYVTMNINGIELKDDCLKDLISATVEIYCRI